MGWLLLLLKKSNVGFVEYFTSNLWFLWAAFISSVIIAVYHRIGSGLVRVLSFAFTFIALLFVPNYGIVSNCVFVFPYFVLGYYVSMCEERRQVSKSARASLLFLFLLIYVILLLLFKKEDFVYISGTCIYESGFKSHQLLIDIYRWLMGLAGSAFIFFSIKTGLIPCLNTTNAFSKIGVISMGVYIVSCYLNPILIHLASTFEPAIWLWCIESLSILIISIVVTLVISRLPLANTILLGGRKIK